MKKLITVIMSLSLALFCMAEPVKKPVVFYLKNLPQERIGEWTDEKIKSDLEAEGYIVIEVDCSSYPKTSPELEEALVQFHINCKNVYSSYENASQGVDIDNVHYVPEGYTIKKNIPVKIILKNDKGVFVITPDLNKEFIETLKEVAFYQGDSNVLMLGPTNKRSYIQFRHK